MVNLRSLLPPLLFLALLPGIATAQWIPDGAPVCTAPGNQNAVSVTPDGSGGAFVFINWSGADSTTATRIDAAGQISGGWPACGVAIRNAPGFSTGSVADGAGGVVVVLADPTNNAFVQNVTASGVTAPGWPASAVPVATSGGPQLWTSIAPDDSGGAFVAWSTITPDIVAQRVTTGGAVAAGWPADGRVLTPGTVVGQRPVVVADGSGGCLTAWSDFRTGAAGADIYAQRLTSGGDVASGWAADGEPLCRAAGDQIYFFESPAAVPDGSGGLIAAWNDGRNLGTSNVDVYVQRITAAGTIAPGWAPDGVAACTAAGTQRRVAMTGDGAGGAILVWEDRRGGGDDLYAQRLTASGSAAPGWPVDGVAVCSVTGDQENPRIVADGTGGAIVAWQDWRSGSADIYAVRLTGSGTTAAGWVPGGTPVSSATADQLMPRLAPDGNGGAILCWTDDRSGGATGFDVYALRLSATGGISTVGEPSTGAPGLIVSAPHPNPMGRETAIALNLPAPTVVTARVYDCQGRAIRELFRATPLPAGPGRLVWDGRSDRGRPVAGGVYFLKVKAAGSEFVRRITIRR